MSEVGVALGGGGARGLAHLGVLRFLESKNIRVGAIAGTSAGGIVGSLYAAGISTKEIERRFAEASLRGLLHARPRGAGLIGLDKVGAWLEGNLGACTFADLHIPFAVTAADLETAEEIILSEGPVVEAVLATIALPGIFPPMRISGSRLIDGGVLDPVPVRAVRELYDGPVVAVPLAPPPGLKTDLNRPSPIDSIPGGEWFLKQRPGQILKVFIRATEIASRVFTDLRLQLDEPEVIIRPDVGHVGILDVPPIEDIVARGEQAAERAYPQLQALLDLHPE